MLGMLAASLSQARVSFRVLYDAERGQSRAVDVEAIQEDEAHEAAACRVRASLATTKKSADRSRRPLRPPRAVFPLLAVAFHTASPDISDAGLSFFCGLYFRFISVKLRLLFHGQVYELPPRPRHERGGHNRRDVGCECFHGHFLFATCGIVIDLIDAPPLLA